MERDIVDIITDIQRNRQQRLLANPGRRVYHELCYSKDGHEFDHHRTSLSVISEHTERTARTAERPTSSSPTSRRKFPPSDAIRAKIDVFDAPPSPSTLDSSLVSPSLVPSIPPSINPSPLPPAHHVLPPSSPDSSLEPLHRGPLLHYDQLRAYWRPALATLTHNSLRVRYLSHPDDLHIVLDLSRCLRAESLRKLPHPPPSSEHDSILDTYSSFSSASSHDSRLGGSSVDTYKPFVLVWADTYHTFASSKALERVDWLSKLWDVISSNPNNSIHPPPPLGAPSSSSSSVSSPSPHFDSSPPLSIASTPTNLHHPIPLSHPRPRTSASVQTASDTAESESALINFSDDSNSLKNLQQEPSTPTTPVNLAFFSSDPPPPPHSFDPPLHSSDPLRSSVRTIDKEIQTPPQTSLPTPKYSHASPKSPLSDFSSPPPFQNQRSITPPPPLQKQQQQPPQPATSPRPHSLHSLYSDASTSASDLSKSPSSTPKSHLNNLPPPSLPYPPPLPEKNNNLSTPPRKLRKTQSRHNLCDSPTPTKHNVTAKRDSSSSARIPPSIVADLRRILTSLNNANILSPSDTNSLSRSDSNSTLNNGPRQGHGSIRSSTTSKDLISLKDELEAVSSALRQEANASKSLHPGSNFQQHLQQQQQQQHDQQREQSENSDDGPTITDKIDYMLKITQILLENQNKVSSALENSARRTVNLQAPPTPESQLRRVIRGDADAAQTLQQQGMDKITELLETILNRMNLAASASSSLEASPSQPGVEKQQQLLPAITTSPSSPPSQSKPPAISKPPSRRTSIKSIKSVKSAKTMIENKEEEEKEQQQRAEKEEKEEKQQQETVAATAPPSHPKSVATPPPPAPPKDKPSPVPSPKLQNIGVINSSARNSAVYSPSLNATSALAPASSSAAPKSLSKDFKDNHLDSKSPKLDTQQQPSTRVISSTPPTPTASSRYPIPSTKDIHHQQHPPLATNGGINGGGTPGRVNMSRWSDTTPGGSEFDSSGNQSSDVTLPPHHHQPHPPPTSGSSQSHLPPRRGPPLRFPEPLSSSRDGGSLAPPHSHHPGGPPHPGLGPGGPLRFPEPLASSSSIPPPPSSRSGGESIPPPSSAPGIGPAAGPRDMHPRDPASRDLRDSGSSDMRPIPFPTMGPTPVPHARRSSSSTTYAPSITPGTLFPQPYHRPGEADQFYNSRQMPGPGFNGSRQRPPDVIGGDGAAFYTPRIPPPTSSGSKRDSLSASSDPAALKSAQQQMAQALDERSAKILEEILDGLKTHQKMTDSAAKYQAEASQYLLKLDDHYRKDVETRTVELKAVTDRLAAMEMALAALKDSLGEFKQPPPMPMPMPQSQHQQMLPPQHHTGPIGDPNAPRNPYDVDLEAFHEGGHVVIDESHVEGKEEGGANNTNTKPKRKLSLSRPQLNGPRTMPIRWWGAPVPSEEAKARWDAVTGKKPGESGGVPGAPGGGTVSSKKDFAARGDHVQEEVGAGEHEPQEREHRSGFDVISGALQEILKRLDLRDSSKGDEQPPPAKNKAEEEENNARDAKLEELMQALRERTEEHENLVKRVQENLALMAEVRSGEQHAQEVVENIREGLGVEIKDFRTFLTGEVKRMLEDVGALREQKRTLESDIAELLSFKNKQIRQTPDFAKQVKPRVAAPSPLRPNNMNGPGGKLQQVAARFAANGPGSGPGGGPRPPR